MPNCHRQRSSWRPCTAAKSGGQVPLPGVDGTAQLTYDTSVERPVLARFRQLSEEIPPGYNVEGLVGSLPERRGLYWPSSPMETPIPVRRGHCCGR